MSPEAPHDDHIARNVNVATKSLLVVRLTRDQDLLLHPAASVESVDGELVAVCEFNEVMAAQDGLQGVIVPIGDGLWVAVLD